MGFFERKKTFIAVTIVAAAVEGAIFYAQLPSSEPKFCASVELGELLAVAAKAEADLSSARSRMQTGPSAEASEEVMRLESIAAAASNDVARHKQAQRNANPPGACAG